MAPSFGPVEPMLKCPFIAVVALSGLVCVCACETLFGLSCESPTTSCFGVSGGLAILPSDLMCKELQLGLGERSRVLAVVLTALGDCEGSLVRLLTKALVSLCVDPRRCDLSLSIIPPETGIGTGLEDGL